MFNDIYRGKNVLVTGSCGFKGSWLIYWLRKLGANVMGYGHRPRTSPNHYSLLNFSYLSNSGSAGKQENDLLDLKNLSYTIDQFKPDLVIHLAAKAIVAKAFKQPQETFYNNVMGAVNLLEVCRYQPSIKGIVCITTDKVYENQEWNWGYRENDKLGGDDPYSASKVCVEQVINCYRKEFFPNIATARAGNVIGGGDWSEYRLIPDIIRATSSGKVMEVHTPGATRPWQHVLEPLCGYLTLGQKILEGKGEDVSTSWNFGPEGEMTVLEILKIAKNVWPKIEYIVNEEETHPSMVQLLKIDSTKARKILGWAPVWTMKKAIERTILWYKNFYESGIISTDNDLEEYCSREVAGE